MKHSLVVSIIGLIFYLSFATSAFAAIELRYSTPPTEIKLDEQFTLSVTLSGADPNTTYYIRGAFFKAGTTQYFGFTQNQNAHWNASASDFTQFYALKGGETANISFKPDATSNYLTPNTDYLFKIGRYTSSGSLSWSDQIPTTITLKSTPTPIPTLTASPSPLPTSPQSISLSEVVACPNSGDPEWVELYNSSENPIVISNWLLKDATENNSQSLSYSFQPKEYAVFELSSSIFNNSGDEVVLLDNQSREVNTFEYEDCESNTSYIFHSDQWKQTQTITKKASNVLTEIVPTPTSTSKPTATPKKAVNTSEKQTDQSPEKSSSDSSTQTNAISEIFEELTIPKEASMPAVAIVQLTSMEPTTQPMIEPTSFEAPEPSSESSNKGAYAIILGGLSYILSAAVLTQKWYTVFSG